MVIRLGKYLRICGFDAVWDLRRRTQDLIRWANAEGRIFLTRNRHVGEHLPVARRYIWLSSDDPVAQLWQVLNELHLEPSSRLFDRCIRCNCDLESIAREAIPPDRVHPNVLARYRVFWRCPNCGTIFWHGSHVRNTCRKLGVALPAPRVAGDGRADAGGEGR